MAHLAKFTSGLEGKKMYEHWSRAKDENGEYITYARADGGGHIDRGRTEQNFTIGEVHPYEWIAERLKGVYQKPGQEKPIESCDIVVTLPQEEEQTPENINKFFNSAYNSLKKKYGKHNNIIGAWVHLDEAQPHLHFAFLPISERVSKQKPEYKEKLSTRVYWPRKNSLQEMHKELQKDIENDLGRKIPSLYDGKTKDQGGNKTITELKKESAELQKELAAQQERLDRLKTLPEEIKELKGEKVSPMFGDEYYKLTPHQYKRLRAIAQTSLQEEEENESLKQENARLKGKNTKLESENTRLTQWMNYYLREAEGKAEEKLGEENKKIKGWLEVTEKEKDELYKEIDELRERNTFLEKIKSKSDMLQKYIREKGQEQDFSKWEKSKKTKTNSKNPHR